MRLSPRRIMYTATNVENVLLKEIVSAVPVVPGCVTVIPEI
jgi:hypothetical protein